MSRCRCVVAVAAACALTATGSALAGTICVPDDYETIQGAIDAAMDGDAICVRPGTYNEAIDFGGKAVRLFSTDGPDMTTIDATGLDTTVVTCASDEGPGTLLEGFTITGGRAEFGGGMYNGHSAPTVRNCTFTANTARFGAGIQNWLGSRPTVTDCTFVENTATGGAGIFVGNGSSAVVSGCVFRRNVAVVSDDEWGVGGGMFSHSDSRFLVLNCTFIDNHAERAGGAMYCDRSSATVTNCTFIANTAGDGRAIACDHGPSDLQVTNGILWDGGEEVWNNDNSTIAITYSTVNGGYEGIGNIDADPLCDADGRPQAGSPCIDAGVNNAVPADSLDLDNDGDTAERLPLDLDGNHRFMDDGGTVDTGCGPVVVDMGAYEFLGEPMHPVIVGDIDGDGIVDFADLLEVLAAWGECDVDCCLADQDFNWVVDVREILLVLGNWG